MTIDWLLEIAKGIGRFFLHPVLYWAIFLLCMTAFLRIKRERKHFGIKIFSVFTEAKGTIGISLLSGLVISLVVILGGFSFPYVSVLLWTVAIIVLSLSMKLSWISPAYTLAATYLLLLLLPDQSLSFLPEAWLGLWDGTSIKGISILLGLLLFVEAVLYLRHQDNDSFPETVVGSRGKTIGQHRLKKLAIVPVFFLIPGGVVEPFASWWPMFSIGGESYGLMAVPALVGYEHLVRGIAPKHAAKTLAKTTFILASVVTALAVGSIYVPILSLVAILVAFLGRELATFIIRFLDQQKNPFFTPRADGLPVLAVIPGSAADKMGLCVGERIEKVNNRKVNNEDDFYYALQKNLAYCKLEVRDAQGEPRFAQRAMYEGEYYELGLVFVKDQHVFEEDERYEKEI